MMQLEDETREKLLKALACLGSQDAEIRAKAAAAIDTFVNRVGGWGTLLKPPAQDTSQPQPAATSLPDTLWQELPLDGDGCAGSRRRYRGATLTVRECRPPVPGTTHPPGQSWAIKWYAAVDGDILVYGGNGQPQLFDTRLWAQQNAEWAASSGEDE